MPERVFALLDCNNFYASCERVFNPKLNGKPVLVLSNNDGCVIARSNEVKALGVTMGAPYHEVKHLVPRHGIHVFSPNFALYGDLSNRVMTILSQYSPTVEVYSIDEAFMDLSGIPDVDRYARMIRKTVMQWVKLPVCIGIARTKTLAKVANHIAKKHPLMRGVLDLTDQSLVLGALKLTPVEDVWGVGRQYTKKLAIQGIRTAYDLAHVDDKWLMSNFAVVLMRTVFELRGLPCADLEIEPPPKKNIMTSRSFGRQIHEFKELKEAIATYAARGAEKMRQDGLAAKSLSVFIQTNIFRAWEGQHSDSAIVRLPVPTNCTHELIRHAHLVLEQIYRPGFGYHKAGVMMLELVPDTQIQQNLFDRADRAKWKSLMHTMDLLNLDHGQGIIRYAAEGMEKRWKMKQAHKSQRFTTSWGELLSL